MHNIVVKMIFGSHLYGTDTPQSDRDYKGIFIPTYEEVLLGRIPKSITMGPKKEGEGQRNKPGDVDTEMYSLHQFIKLACEGQTVALDMLHAPIEMAIDSSSMWFKLRTNRHRFYSKNLNAFVGYARHQAAKYGMKGSRLDAVMNVTKYLESRNQESRLAEVWDGLPEGEHITKHPASPPIPRTYEACGRKVHETCTVEYALKVFRKYEKNYGERARMAATNEGIDWKAISHAIRAAYEVKELLSTGTITLPLPQADTLKRIKAGTMDYLTQVSPLLESLMEENERLSEQSLFPEQVDRQWWDQWLIETLDNHYQKHQQA